MLDIPTLFVSVNATNSTPGVETRVHDSTPGVETRVHYSTSGVTKHDVST